MKKIIILLIFLIHSIQLLESLEIKAFIEDIEKSQRILESVGATLDSHYMFTDHIFSSIQTMNSYVSEDFNQDYLRIRHYFPPSHSKSFFIATQKKGGKRVFQKTRDTYMELRPLFPDHLLQFSFFREGWKYHLKNILIYIEKVNYLDPTVEVVFDKEHEKIAHEMLSRLSASNVIQKSVPALVYQVLKPWL